MSIVLNICVRLECKERAGFTYLGTHLNRNEECLEFYQSEGVYLALWNLNANSKIISKNTKISRNLTSKKAKIT